MMTTLLSRQDEILFRRGKTNAIFSKIVNGVIPSQECVTENPNGTYTVNKKEILFGSTERGRDIEALEGGDTSSLSVHDIIRCRETEIISGESESNIWKGRNFITIDSVSAIPRFLCTNFLVQ